MPKSANVEYQLTDSQIADLAVRANQGDTKAAMRLGFYYDFVAGDHDSAYTWLRKAADYGDPKAQFNLGVRTFGKGGSEACGDARYWFPLAQQNGFAKAEKELDRLKGCTK